MLSCGHFSGNKFNFFVRPVTDWNRLSDDQVKAPTLQDCKQGMATPAPASSTPLLYRNWNLGPAMHEIKI